MNKFVIVDGLPYLIAGGKTFSCRFDEKGFTVGAEVELASVPERTYPEAAIKAKCAGHLDSILISEPDAGDEKEPENQNTEKRESKENGESRKAAGAESDNLDEMKMEELKAYASDNDIALNGAKTKAEILEVIRGTKK